MCYVFRLAKYLYLPRNCNIYKGWGKERKKGEELPWIIMCVCMCVCSCLIENLQIEHHHILLSIFRQFVSGCWQRGRWRGNWYTSGVWDQLSVRGRQLADNFARALHKLQQLEYFPYSWQRQSQNSHTNCLFPCGSSRRNSTRCSAGMCREARRGGGLRVGGCWQHLHKLRRLNLGKTNQASVEPAPNWDNICTHVTHTPCCTATVCVCVASINELFACYWIRGKRSKEKRGRGRGMKWNHVTKWLHLPTNEKRE